MNAVLVGRRGEVIFIAELAPYFEHVMAQVDKWADWDEASL